MVTRDIILLFLATHSAGMKLDVTCTESKVCVLREFERMGEAHRHLILCAPPPVILGGSPLVTG